MSDAEIIKKLEQENFHLKAILAMVAHDIAHGDMDDEHSQTGVWLRLRTIGAVTATVRRAARKASQ